MASADQPLAAKRPATLRMWSVRPRFSWMTRTEPRGLAAGAQAPCSVPRGPVNVIACVPTTAQPSSVPDPSPDWAASAAGALAGAAAAPNAVSIVVAALAPRPSRPSRRIASLRVMMPSA